MTLKRKYPVGIQDFETIRREGYVYVDKTALIYKLISEGRSYFLSRPRRFGKSLLVSTLTALFEGRRELFEAFTTDDVVVQPQLYIVSTNWKWDAYPVLRFDFSSGDILTAEQLDGLISDILSRYEAQYEINPASSDINLRMINLVLAAERQTGHKVVVLCDEYDNQMLHAVGNKPLQEALRHSFQNLFGSLKALDGHLRFVFITGISKFSQMGVFSKLNQLENISLQTGYEAICGISEQELETTLHTDIEYLAAEKGMNSEALLAEMKQNYDGYHFGRSLTDMYNPFSLFNAFKSGELNDFWFSSATPGALIEMLEQMPPIELHKIDGVECEAAAFDRPFTTYRTPLPVLFQSGYLTIKHYDCELDSYTLGLPNSEVRRGFADSLYQCVTHRHDQDDADKSLFLLAFKYFRKDNDLHKFMDAMKAFFAGIPYQLSNDNERHFQALLYTLLVSFGADVVAEELSAQGRADIVLRMPQAIYIFEMKYDGTADEALRQIEERDYTQKYALDSRPVIPVGVAVGSKERNIVDWETGTPASPSVITR